MNQVQREKQWELEDDARTIERYSELSQKEDRFKAASEHLQQKHAATAAALATIETNKAVNAAIRGMKG